MSEFQIRPMTSAEFAVYRERSIRDYAAEHVRAGNWNSSQAEALAAKQTDDLLPDGVDTPGMVLLAAETTNAGVIGIVWVELQHEQTTGAWIYDIQIDEEFRGAGLGRTTLRSAEEFAKAHGATQLGLNVFGSNAVARHLYETSGFQVKNVLMYKDFD